MRKWCVYMHTNRDNGKRYIGVTGQKPAQRWANGAGYRGNLHFSAAIKKYGWDAFQHDILYTGLTREEAARLEVDLIAKYHTTDPAFGYNTAPGGFTPSPTQETRDKIRKANLGKTLSETTREKLHDLAVGRYMSPTTREKISETMKGRAARNRAAVLCVETGEEFPSMEHAARAVGVPRPGISVCCRDPRRTAGGYHWRLIGMENPGPAGDNHINTDERRKKA